MVKSAKKILKSNKGETLLESIASLLMFTILMLAVTSMIAASLRITTYASSQYRILRVNAKSVEETVATHGSGSITFESDGVGSVDGSPDQKVVEVYIKKPSNMDIFAFAPYLEE